MMNIIFDLDGTLWDSSFTVRQAWENVFKRYNIDINNDLEQIIDKCMGLKFLEIVELLKNEIKCGIDINVLLQDCQKEELKQIELHGGNLYKNVKETLIALKEKNNLYIVSYCQKGYIEAFLKHYSFDNLFLDYICPKNFTQTKSECLNILIKKNNIKNFVFIGDTDNDLVASQNNGGRFIYAEYGFGHLSYSPKIKSFDEITKTIDLFHQL